MTKEYDEQATLNFYMKHVEPKVCRKILDQTRWGSFTEYELSNRENDMFDCNIVNGVLNNTYPDVDEFEFLVTEISLHHLTRTFRNHLLKKYLVCDSLIEYETQYADSNTLYVVVAYNEREFTEKDNEDKPKNIDAEPELPTQTNTLLNYFDYESDNEKNKEYEPLWSQVDHISESLPQDGRPLSGFRFKINTKTGKSYVLFRDPETVFGWTQKHDNKQSMEIIDFGEGEDGWVKFSDSYVYPRTWDVIENYRPIYFKNKHEGWIVGLAQKERLEALGATFC